MISKAAKSMGLNVVLMCDPGIKIEEGYEPYESGKKEGMFLKYPDGTDYSGQVWPGWCHFPGLYQSNNPRMVGQHFKDYVDLGVEGFWNDMNEIATWGNMLPDVIEFDMEGNKGTALVKEEICLRFMMSRSTYEGTKKLLKNKRPFNLTRSAYAGAFNGIQQFGRVITLPMMHTCLPV
jgi:alpha-glucosidase